MQRRLPPRGRPEENTGHHLHPLIFWSFSRDSRLERRSLESRTRARFFVSRSCSLYFLARSLPLIFAPSQVVRPSPFFIPAEGMCLRFLEFLDIVLSRRDLEWPTGVVGKGATHFSTFATQPPRTRMSAGRKPGSARAAFLMFFLIREARNDSVFLLCARAHAKNVRK